MKVEVLYPELANLNGDLGNMRYLEKCLVDAEFIETEINNEPAFVSKDDISLIYMGTLSENGQEIVIQKLKPYKDRIVELIEKGQVFLLTGNSIEVFGEYIENEDGSKIEGLGIFPVHSKRDMMNRHNSLYLGKYNDIDILGFKSQFTMLYGDNEQTPLFTTDMGIGINKESRLEGIHKNNFFATYLIGPFLILNPLFTSQLMKLMKVEEPKLAFEEDILAAYDTRLKKFKELADNSK